VLSQDGATVRLDFAERDCSHSGPFESETESPDAAEKVKDIKAHNPLIPLWESSIIPKSLTEEIYWCAHYWLDSTGVIVICDVLM
jgi:hypothetical protein